MRSLLPLAALLSCSGAATAEESSPLRRRRRRLGSGSNDAGGRASSDDGDFYDLSSMTKDEKLFMAKAAYALTFHSENTDWESKRDDFARTVIRDKVVNSSTDGNDDAYDGHTDGTLDELESSLLGLEDTSVDGSDDAYDGKTDDTLAISDERAYQATSRRRRLQDVINNIDGAVFDGYEYSKGNCPNPGTSPQAVPCAPDNLSALCNKYDRDEGAFSACLEACKPAFCCIHDAPPDLNPFAPNCNQDENCPQYNYCYIAWWKLHDTVGPALFLRIEQDDDFYDVPADEIAPDSTGDPFFTQVLLHHFDDMAEIIADVSDPDTGDFDAQDIFLDPFYWEYPETGVVEFGG